MRRLDGTRPPMVAFDSQAAVIQPFRPRNNVHNNKHVVYNGSGEMVARGVEKNIAED